MKVLAFAGSPRRNGNTRILLDAFIGECTKRGHEVELIDLTNTARWNINPCLGCDSCLSGRCIRDDSMQEIYPKIREADAIVLAAPMQFYSFPSQAKAVIDRAQLFFNQKYKRKEPVRSKPCKGFLISCGATKGAKLFDGACLTMKYWFDALDVHYEADALLRGIDAPGEIRNHPEALDEVRALVDHLS